MPIFGRKEEGNRCPHCRLYVMVQNRGYCAKTVPSNINVRLLSEDGVKRNCAVCPAEMTCGSYQSR